MSKFLKFIVNTVVFCAIIVAGALLIPPFAGVTTVIVDDLAMDTNLAKGSVTYALDAHEYDFDMGDKALISEGGSQYVYEVVEFRSDSCVLEDKLSTDGAAREIPLTNLTKKVVITIPYIGYFTMALKTTEGLIIVGLAVVFLIILFILAEIWKKDDDDEEEEEPEEEISGRRGKKQEKKRAKAEQKQAKASPKRAKKAGRTDDETAGATEDASGSTMDRELLEETSSSLAAGVADLMRGESDAASARESGRGSESVAAEGLDRENLDRDNLDRLDRGNLDRESMESGNLGSWNLEGRKLAIPFYTREELIERARAAGENPEIIEDEDSGITFLDYSDIL